MRIVLAILLGICGVTAYSQPSKLIHFVKSKQQEDSAQQLLLIKRVQEENLPWRFVDSVGQRTFLLISAEGRGYTYLSALNSGAAQTTGASQLQDEAKGFRLTGEGITCGIWDDGLVKDHIEFDTRILSKEGSVAFNHATHVTGTLLAAGVNTTAKGIAPKAKAYTFDYENDFSEMTSLAAEDDTGLLFSNHSYGTVTGWSRPNGVWTWFGDPSISTEEDYRHGFYNQRVSNTDALAYRSPYYTIVWAAGNDRFETGDGSRPADCNRGTGYDCIIPDAVGKNIITVGAVSKVVNYTSPASVIMSHYSSWGPTDDGRIKPDVVSAGTNLFSTVASGVNEYGNSTGTSMATPTVAGSLMLLQELYAKLNAGKFMKAATLKALAIHTAKEAGPKPGPDYQFGWGLLDVKAAADLLMTENDKEVRIVEGALQNGETFEMDVHPLSNKKITLTLCWTDPEGTPAAPSLDPLDRMLVNDLDVRLIDEDGIITSPWILNPSVPQAQATHGDNTRDNVEKIEFETPLAKKYTVLVRHKGNLKDEKQDFSLVLTYQESVLPSKVFYWVGGAGNWNDVAHWSFTSGGTSAAQLPGENDIVIVDETSLLDAEIISLQQNAHVAKLTWHNSRNAGLNLNGYALHISNQCIISTSTMRMTGGGELRLTNSLSGVLNLSGNDFSEVDMVFESGSWEVNGSFQIKNIRIEGGKHTWKSKHITVDRLLVEGAEEWNISSVVFLVGNAWQMPTSTFQFISTHAIIEIQQEGVEMDWKGHDFIGALQINSIASVLMRGESKIASLFVEGRLETQDSFSFDHIQLSENAVWRLADNTNQTVTTSFSMATSSNVELSALSNASITLQQHNKLCFENATLRNVDVLGNAVVNVGLSSTVENSKNWLQQACEEVLFADFAFNYPCARGLTQFQDTSLGSPSSWEWSFEKDLASEQNSTEQSPTHSFTEPGVFTVSLTVKKGSQTNSYSQQLEIGENTLSINEVILNSEGKLMSLSTAPSYQWYNNRVVVLNEVNRTFNHQQLPGFYEVLVTANNCNRLSQPYVVTDVRADQMDLAIFPNPADDFVNIEAAPGRYESWVVLIDTQGRIVRDQNNDLPIQTTDLPEGIYILQLRSSSGQLASRKVMVLH